jgi:hypothetical protein
MRDSTASKIKILIVKKRIESKPGGGKVCGNRPVALQAISGNHAPRRGVFRAAVHNGNIFS